MLRDYVSTVRYRSAKLDHETDAHVAGVQRVIARAAQIAADAHKNAADASEAAALARNAAAEAVGWADKADKSAAEAKGYADDAAESARRADASAAEAAKSAEQARAAADRASSAAASATKSARQAASSAAQARTYANLAYGYAEQARLSALEALQDAAAAAKAASEALEIAAKKQLEEDLARREADTAPGGSGAGTVDGLKEYENGSVLLEFDGVCYLNGVALPAEQGYGKCVDLAWEFDQWLGDWAGSIQWGGVEDSDQAGLMLLAAFCHWEDNRPFVDDNNRAACGTQLLSMLEGSPEAMILYENGIGSGLAKLFRNLGKKVGIKVKPPMWNVAQSSALHEAYKNILRKEMAKPYVQDSTLAKFVDTLYRPGAQIGSGSTAAAVRLELANSVTVGGRTHSQKAKDAITYLQNWLSKNPTAAAGDRAAAENLIRDMLNALNGL
ncbi:hypothetical protein [Streptomyces shaanxiensis]